MASRNQNMKDWFRYRMDSIRSQPMNAWKFGLVIQDRTLRGSAYGLKRNHIPFQYLGESGEIPPLTKTANYEESQILGRFEPLKSYSNSSDIKFSLNLTYYADGTERVSDGFTRQGYEQGSGNTSRWTIEQITRITAKLESLVYPQYDGFYSPPRYCLLNIGSIYISLPIVLTSVSIIPLPPYSVRDLTPMRRNVTLEMASYYPTYQAISSDAILQTALDLDFRTSTVNLPRKVYAYKKFKKRLNV